MNERELHIEILTEWADIDDENGDGNAQRSRQLRAAADYLKRTISAEDVQYLFKEWIFDNDFGPRDMAEGRTKRIWEETLEPPE